MSQTSFVRALLGTLLAAVLSVPPLIVAAWADVEDYGFELVKKEIKQGEAVVAVRLVDKRSGKNVPDAVIFAKRLDMAPDGMETMTTEIEQLPSTEPGIYRFKTKLTMAGNWRLSLGAKVQGETGTAADKLAFQAVK